jgi:hypothetical protein
MLIERNRPIRKIYLSQPNHIRDLLKLTGLENCNPARSPMEHKVILKKDMREEISGETLPPYVASPEDCTRYQSYIGTLMYIMRCTRPDIAYAISLLSRFNSAPQPEHFDAVKRVCRYIKGTASMRLCLGGSISNNTSNNKFNLCGYSDADWGGCADTARSTTGYMFLLGDSPISWGSTRQSSTALSTCEAEYMALSAATQEAISLISLINSLGVPKITGPISMFCDNQGAVDLAKNPVAHKRTKHIHIRYHFVRERIEDNTISLTHVPTQDMLADVLTKSLGATLHTSFIKRIGLCI